MTEDHLHLRHLDACRTAFPDAPAACGRLLLVGEDNPLSLEPEHALFPYPEGCSGWRLCFNVFGVRRLAYLATWRTNLCVGKWNRKAAAERAQALVGHDTPWDTIVLLGSKVREIFAPLGARDAFQYRTVPIKLGPNEPKTFTLVSLPHPSGRNTVWNDRRATANARMLLAELVPDYPWGEAL